MSEEPYQQGEPPKWAEGLSRLKTRYVPQGEGRAVYLYGPCPRCGHDIEKNLTGPGVRFAPSDTEDTDAQYVEVDLAQYVEVDVFLRCNCDVTHGGAPENSSGCGAEGGVRVRLIQKQN